MSATDALTDAGRLTARYLSALWVRGLLKLGAVVLFLGVGFTGLQLTGAPLDPETVDEPADLWAYAWLFAGGIGVYAALRYLAATLEFVFVTSLRTREVALRQYLRDHLGAGLWLLLFRAAIVAGALAVVAAAAALLVGTDPVAFETAGTQQGLMVGSVALLAGFGWLTVDTLTTGFVVPIMQHSRCGPLSGWRRFIRAMSSNPLAVVAFLLVAWIVGFALWLVLLGLGFAIGFFGVLVVVLLGSALTAIHSAFEPVVFVLILAGVIGYQYTLALIEAPVRSYVRYYALVVLGETDPELDLITDYRAELTESADDSLTEHVEQSPETAAPAADGTDSEKTTDDSTDDSADS